MQSVGNSFFPVAWYFHVQTKKEAIVSNRESGQRSRLRQQAECDERAQHVEALKEENANLEHKLVGSRASMSSFTKSMDS
ncbi:hypothetical protein V6N12_042695 [Hibiscus sabdariffa]|uniref:BZIP domain-containing protein n=1 Tax=Hibiscus sabdariffa TaxID=183260 RepID=A0ABR2B5L8_9ROSI